MYTSRTTDYRWVAEVGKPLIFDEWYPDPDVSVSCALPDAGRVLVAALGVVVVALALVAWGVRKLRPW